MVDLGHHAPNVNIEMIVARLIHVRRLGGFHFNDSKYGDDDLDTGSIDPYRLFLIFNELVDADRRKVSQPRLAHMLDQSHNVTDPIESLMTSAIDLQRAYAQALLVCWSIGLRCPTYKTRTMRCWPYRRSIAPLPPMWHRFSPKRVNVMALRLIRWVYNAPVAIVRPAPPDVPAKAGPAAESSRALRPYGCRFSWPINFELSRW